MFNSIVEAARNSSFKSPFTVHCDPLISDNNKELVAGRNIAAAATAEAGNSCYLIDSWQNINFINRRNC